MTIGGQLKRLSVGEKDTGEGLAIKVDSGITRQDVIDTLAVLFAMGNLLRPLAVTPGRRS